MSLITFPAVFGHFPRVHEDMDFPRGEKGVVRQRRGVLFHCRLDLSRHMVGICSITLITVNQTSLMLMTLQMMSFPPRNLINSLVHRFHQSQIAPDFKELTLFCFELHRPQVGRFYLVFVSLSKLNTFGNGLEITSVLFTHSKKAFICFVQDFYLVFT